MEHVIRLGSGQQSTRCVLPRRLLPRKMGVRTPLHGRLPTTGGHLGGRRPYTTPRRSHEKVRPQSFSNHRNDNTYISGMKRTAAL